MNHYLFKTEPEEYSLQHLEAAGSVRWDGIRNYGARNRLRDCRPGDEVLFYHSGRKPAVVGVARVASDPYPDPTQFDATSDYYDPKSTADKPRWWSVDIEFASAFSTPVPLSIMKVAPELAELEVLQRQRLSVSLVNVEEFRWICAQGAR